MVWLSRIFTRGTVLSGRVDFYYTLNFGKCNLAFCPRVGYNGKKERT